MELTKTDIENLQHLQNLTTGMVARYREMIELCEIYIAKGENVNDWKQLKLKCEQNLTNIQK